MNCEKNSKNRKFREKMRGLLKKNYPEGFDMKSGQIAVS